MLQHTTVVGQGANTHPEAHPTGSVERRVLVAVEMRQCTFAGAFLLRKAINALSALAQLMRTIFPGFLEQAASLYTESFSRSATNADVFLAEPLSSITTPVSVTSDVCMGFCFGIDGALATSPAQAGTTIKANNNGRIVFMVIFPL